MGRTAFLDQVRFCWILIANFRGLESVNEDIKALNFKESDLKQFGSPKEEKLLNGVLFYWTTPTFGSSNYYYLSNPDDRHLAFKLGPVPGIVIQDFEIDWSHAVWKK